MHVLLVDDEEELVSALAERLTIRGIDVAWATSSADALNHAQGEQFDIAVLDLKMPHIGGIELKQRLLTIQPTIGVIFLSGYGSEDEFERVLAEVGEDHYLVKPVDIKELIDAMHAVLGEGKGA